MYDDTVTLFNRYRSSLGDMWYATILHDVDLNTDRATVVSKFGETSADKAVLHVKYALEDGRMMIEGKPYLPPKEWEQKTNDLMPETLTFTSGQDFDFFMSGEWEGSSTIMDDDYLDGFYSFLNAHRDGVYAITHAAAYSVIPHFEIGGK